VFYQLAAQKAEPKSLPKLTNLIRVT
jgi:hypothetical protein